MTTIAATTGTTGGLAEQSRNEFNDDYETFLLLLTTQLQNQDPTNPMDTNEFTQQLVSYSALEQDINQNESLEQLVSLMGNFVNSSAISYVGDIVTIDGTRTSLTDGSATWNYDVARDGADGTLEIRNAEGVVVRTDRPRTDAGEHVFQWNGRMDNGETAPDGEYSITIVVRDNADVAVPVSTAIEGVVEKVDLRTTVPTLVVNGQSVSLDAVQAVRPGNG